MSGHAFRMDMGNLISVPGQSAPPSYTITHAHSFMFWSKKEQGNNLHWVSFLPILHMLTEITAEAMVYVSRVCADSINLYEG